MTIEEIFPHIYRAEIPLPQNPLKATNSYVIQGDGRYLVIDTGMNRDECRKAMENYLSTLGVDLGRTDFFITHLHADHFGLVAHLARENSKIYFNRPDARILQDPHHWERIMATARAHGFPEDELQSAMQKHPGRRYQPQGPLPLTLLKEGDRVPIGEYVLECVETPGHTRGHLCLYERRTQIFFPATISSRISPPISPCGPRMKTLSSNSWTAWTKSIASPSSGSSPAIGGCSPIPTGGSAN